MVSIIIPLYNKEQSIGRTIHSVLNQSVGIFELIVVDDCSTDSSFRQAASFSDPRLKFVRHPQNKGVSAARNSGIRQASGDLIAFLDGDDYWETNFLEEITGLVSAYPAASVFSTNFRQIGANGTGKQLKYPLREKGYVHDFFKSAKPYPLICSSTAVVRKACFERVGYFDPQISHGEDTDMWVRLMSAYRFAYSPEVLATICLDAENRSDSVVPEIAGHYAFKINLNEAWIKGSSYRYLRRTIFNAVAFYLIHCAHSVLSGHPFRFYPDTF